MAHKGLLLVAACCGVALLVASPGRSDARRRRPQRSVGDAFTATVPQRVVQPGDTLWALCEQVTGKAWIWPQIWAMNPEITNPHWLYPGDLVRFESGAEPPSRAEMVASAIDIGISNPSEAAVERVSHGPRVEVVRTAPTPRQRSRRQHVFANIFLTHDEIKEVGKLSNAMPDRILLVPGDTLYLRMGKKQVAKTGDKFMIYRTARRVTHPVTGRSWGYITEITGLATVLRLDKDVAEARLDRALKEVERGQMVAPYAQDLLLDVSETANTHPKAVAGVILATEADPVAVGEQKLVFIDRGTKDGLARGNTLRVLSRGDEKTGESRNMRPIDIGTLLVVDAKESMSSCIVVDSQREIWPGDPILADAIQPASDAAAPAAAAAPPPPAAAAPVPKLLVLPAEASSAAAPTAVPAP